jgi:hypothetical protein
MPEEKKTEDAGAAGKGEEAAGKPRLAAVGQLPDGATPGKSDERTPDEKDFARAMMEEQGFAAEAPPAATKPPETPPAEPKPEEPPPPKGEEAEEEAGEDAEKAEKGKLPPEVQEKIDKRIGKEVHRRKETEELLEAERTLTKELTAKVSELEEQGRQAPAGGSGAINPLLMADSEAELDKREDFLWQAEEWCEENIDGHEGDGSKENPSYTSAEIRRRLLTIRRERERDLPRARETIKRRAAFDAVTRESYPELADPRSELSVDASRLLARAPGLRAIPEYRLLLGDLLAGRKAREEKKTPPRKTAMKSPPPAPGAPVPPRSGIQLPGKPKPKTTMETFAEGEFSDDALAKALD